MTAHADLQSDSLSALLLRTTGGIAYRKDGEGPPLVLLHGSAGSWRHWVRNIEPLSRVRTVITLDLPGYGDSPDVDPEISVDSYVDLVFAAILEICPGSERIGLAGFSFGGQIAAASASRLGGRAQAVALLTPSGFQEPKGRVIHTPRRNDFERTVTGRREFHRRMLLTIMLSDPVSVDDSAVDIQIANTARARFNGRHISWSRRMPALLAEIACPILLVYGEEDPMPFPSYAERIALCRSVRPDVQVALVPKAGHWLQFERPAETNRLLIDFFGSVSYP